MKGAPDNETWSCWGMVAVAGRSGAVVMVAALWSMCAAMVSSTLLRRPLAMSYPTDFDQDNVHSAIRVHFVIVFEIGRYLGEK